MRFILFVSCFVMLFFMSFLHVKSAETKAAKSEDTLVYTYQTMTAADAGYKNLTDSITVNIEFPWFKGQQKLNNEIKRDLLNEYKPDSWKDTSFKQAIILFVKNYLEDKKNRPLVPAYSLDLSANIILRGSALIVIQLNEDAFDGGAHGNAYTNFLNWNAELKTKINLKDLLVKGYDEQLNKIAERIFRKQEGLADTASLSNGYFFDKGKFYLNNNFSITPSGLNFLYNEYEIKSYAEGTTELLIPYSQIKSLIKPNTVLAQFIK